MVIIENVDGTLKIKPLKINAFLGMKFLKNLLSGGGEGMANFCLYLAQNSPFV